MTSLWVPARACESGLNSCAGGKRNVFLRNKRRSMQMGVIRLRDSGAKFSASSPMQMSPSNKVRVPSFGLISVLFLRACLR